MGRARVMQHGVDGIKVGANGRSRDVFYRGFQGKLRVEGRGDFARISAGGIIFRQPGRAYSNFLAPSGDEHAVGVEILRPERQSGKG